MKEIKMSNNNMHAIGMDISTKGKLKKTKNRMKNIVNNLYADIMKMLIFMHCIYSKLNKDDT